ncbi:MAG: hypothetical protein ACI9BW_003810 [Gammaproteobacteria bacterium]|jgi:hypothetical protein
MLRESGKMSGQTYKLAGAINPSIDSGVENGQELVKFADAITGVDGDTLNVAREALVSKMGTPAIITASIIAANFSMLDRIANAIGISLDDMMVKPSADIRELLGINNFPSAANTLG